jgi:nucleoside-diphosphate-sugar epimerase
MTTTVRRICVTGATGKAGRAAVRELREQGYEVVATDNRLTGEDVAARVLRADLTDYGQATEVFPDVPLTREIGEFDTLLAINRAKQLLGYEPRHSWRDQLAP